MAKESKFLGFGLQNMMDNTKLGNWLTGLIVIVFSIVATFAITGNIDQITSLIGFAFDSGNTYFISPAGSDNYPGTETQPFKTFTHAMTFLVPGDTLVLEDGIYKEQLKVNKFGSDGQPITITAKNLHKAVLAPIPPNDPEKDECRSAAGFPGTCLRPD